MSLYAVIMLLDTLVGFLGGGRQFQIAVNLLLIGVGGEPAV